MEDCVMRKTGAFSSSFFIVAAICLVLQVSGGLAGEFNTASDFTPTNLEGQKVTLTSYKGKVVILNFWRTWCEPCKAEMPSLNKLYLEHWDKGLVVLAI
jgi:thiol-disulfide isomerase/thioredoxin